MSNSDAAVIKALEELGLHSRPDSLSPQIDDLETRLADYNKEFGTDLDPAILQKYLANTPT